MNPNQHQTAQPGRRRFLRGSAGLLAGSAAYLLACGGDEDKASEAQSTATGGTAPAGATSGETPKRGGRLLEAWYTSTNNLNPTTNYTEGIMLSGVKSYDRLTSFRLGMDSAREYRLEAAQSVEQPDSTTLIFKLKPGLKYQNRAPVSGRAVTADDVVKREYYTRDNPIAAGFFQREVMLNATAPDAETVLYKLKQPNAFIFSGAQMGALGAVIVPQELLDNLDTNWPIGSGPYELVEHQLNARYLYKRFDGYRDADKGFPYIDEKEVRILPDQAAQEAAFRSEQLHNWRVPVPTLADALRKELGSKITVDEFLSTAPVALSVNTLRPPYNDVRVREAIYRILDRQQYLNLLEGGRGQVAPGPIPAGLDEYQLDPKQTEKYFKQDPRAAKQLLDAAGFPYNKEIDLSCLTTPRNNQGMEVFQQQAAQVGMKVQPIAMPFAEWGEKRRSGDWDMWYAGNPAFDTPSGWLRFNHSNSFTANRNDGLKDPAMDPVIEKSEQTLDRNERSKQIRDIQIMLLDRYAPMIITHNYNDIWAHWNFLRNYELMVSTQPLYLTDMWIDK